MTSGTFIDLVWLQGYLVRFRFQNWSVPVSIYQRTLRLTVTAPQYPALETRVDYPVHWALYTQVAVLREPVFTISPGLEQPLCVPVIVSVWNICLCEFVVLGAKNYC